LNDDARDRLARDAVNDRVFDAVHHVAVEALAVPTRFGSPHSPSTICW
jgi:hypothetical protein